MFPVSGAAVPNIAGADLVDETELQLTEAGPAEFLVEEQRPESLVLDLVLEILDERLDLRVLRSHGVREHHVERLDLFAAELLHPVELLLELGFRREIPGHAVSFAGVAPFVQPHRPCDRRGSGCSLRTRGRQCMALRRFSRVPRALRR
jgi:hypothetical protein